MQDSQDTHNADKNWWFASFTFISTELLVIMEGIELIFLEIENWFTEKQVFLSPG